MCPQVRLWWQGRMLYASTPHEVDQLCRRLLGLGVAAVGFDIEWRVTFKSAHCMPSLLERQ